MKSRPLFVALVALVALAAAFLPDPRPADAGSLAIESVTVEPAAPTRLDAISITVAGTRFTGCPVSSAYTRVGNKISITMQQKGQICSFVILPFSITEQIGTLPAGEYQVEACQIEGLLIPGVSTCTSGFGASEISEASIEVSFLAVGGIAELPRLESEPLAADSSNVHAGVVAGILAAAAAGVLALGGAAWYARKRFTN